MAAITICSDFGAPQNKVWHCFHCFPIYLPWSDGTGCHDLRFLNVELSANFFTLHFHFHQEAYEFLFTFCHKGGVICISEVIDISPGNLDSSLCFFQPSVSHGSLGLVIILQIQDASNCLFYQHDILCVKYFQVIPIKTSHRASPPPSSMGMRHLQDSAIYSCAPPSTSHLSTVANPAFCPHDVDSKKFPQFIKNGIHSGPLARLFHYHNSLLALSDLHSFTPF